MAPSGLAVVNTRGQRCPRYQPGLRGCRCGPVSPFLCPLLSAAQAEKGSIHAKIGRPYSYLLWKEGGSGKEGVVDGFGRCVSVAPWSKPSGGEIAFLRGEHAKEGMKERLISWGGKKL